MKCEIDLEALYNSGLQSDKYIYLYLLHNKIDFPKWKLWRSSLEELENDGYIKIINSTCNEVIERQKCIDLFTIKKKELTIPIIQNEITNLNSVSSWIDEWRSIFPSGKNDSGYAYRGDKQGCILKMHQFIKVYPEYSIYEIFTATKNFVDSFKRKGYTYMTTAAYFIKKDGNSVLASICEANRNNKHEIKEEEGKTRIGNKEF